MVIGRRGRSGSPAVSHVGQVIGHAPGTAPILCHGMEVRCVTGRQWKCSDAVDRHAQLMVGGETGRHGDRAVSRVGKAYRSDTEHVTALLQSTAAESALAQTPTDDPASWRTARQMATGVRGRSGQHVL